MNNFIPDIYAKNIYSIDYKKLKERGIKCILFDLDNTIAPLDEKEPSKEIKELFSYIDDLNMKVIILSNSGKERVAPFKEILNVDSCHSSKKPLKHKYKKIMKMFNYSDSEVAAAGDQILTDVWGANRAGILSIFLDSLTDKDGIFTRFNRKIERIILNHFSKRGVFERGRYYGK